MKASLKLFLILVVAFATASAYAESFKAPELSGQIFTYFRYDLTSYEDDADWQKGGSDFGLDRCYLTAKGALTEKFYYRVTGDVARDTITSYYMDEGQLFSYTTQGKYSFFLKYGYLDVREIINNHSIYAGMEKMPYAEFEQDIWGWRAIRRVAADERGFVNTADLGLGVGGQLWEGVIDHHLTITNGAGYRNPEVLTSGKDLDYRITGFPFLSDETWKGLSVSAMVRAGNLGEKVPEDTVKHPLMVYGGLLGYQGEYISAGAGYFMRGYGEDNEELGSEKVNSNLMTVHATGHFRASEGMTIHPLLRYDSYDPDTANESEAANSHDKNTVIIAGVGLKFFGDTLALIPNYQKDSYESFNIAEDSWETKSNDSFFIHAAWDWQ